MKLKLILIFLTISQFLNSQTFVLDESKEFIRLLDSAKTKFYKKKFETRLSHCASNGARHHNLHLAKLWKDGKSFYISHTEEKVHKSKSGNFKYLGNDTILKSFIDRAEYYCHGRFQPVGECVLAGTFHSDEFIKGIGASSLFEFFDSPPHKRILMADNYKEIGIHILFDIVDGVYYVTVMTGN